MIIQPSLRQTQQQTTYQPKRYGTKAPLDPETEAAFAAADAELGNQALGRCQRTVPTQQNQPSDSIDISSLQARIAELEAEQARLRQSEQEARSEAQAKHGEIAIVRSNQEKVTKQYEARIAVMQRLHADEAAKSKAELDAQRKDRQKMETDNRFLQHDLAQEAERAKRVNGPGRSRGSTRPTQRETPKKSKKTALGDGFDDNEILMASPSRSKDKGKDQTPKAGAKRKRTVNDSPAAALSFTQPQPLRHESSEQTTASFEQAQLEAIVVKDESKYACMQLILNHCPYEGHERSVEALTKHALPSDTERTLSSIFLDEISATSSPDDEKLSVQVARVLLRLWSHCLQEKYFAPVYLILDMLRFALRSESSATKSQFIEEAVPLCTRAIEMVATPRARTYTDRKFAASFDREKLETLAEELDMEATLDFLQELCQAASLSAERREAFWRTVEIYLVLSMLNKAQPIHQIMSMLQMVATSARATSLGVISADAAEQSEHERKMIESLTNLLFETLEAPKDEPAYSEDEVLEVRIAVLKVLKEMCQKDHGTLVLTGHRSAIGRLVRFLEAQVGRLYHVRPPLGLSESNAEKRTYALIAETVNRSTRLLYHILRTFDDPSKAVQKLHVVHGGYHKFIVSLTRIALTEQAVFEAGIENEVSEAAHSILDNILNAEGKASNPIPSTTPSRNDTDVFADGEAVMKAFETPRGSHGSTTEKFPSDETQDDDTTMSEPG